MHPDNSSDSADDDDIEYISKSELKRQAESATNMGKQLVELDKPTLRKLELPENILDNVLTTQAIKAHVARKRQLHYLGKLIRSADMEQIAQQLAKLTDRHRHDTAQFHQVEDWRDKLLKDGDTAITTFVNDFPTADRQHLRQLVRQAQQEAKKGAAPAAARKLFRYVKDFVLETR